jgi:anti-anti-sigma factor
VTIESTQTASGVIVKVAGRMDAESAPAFEEACKGWVDRGVYQLVVDMSELAYVSSMGLRSFITIGKMAQEKGGRLRLCRLTGLVKQVFEITRLTTIFPIHESVESALATQ